MDDRPTRMLDLIVSHGSLAMIFAALVAVGIGAPLSEDVVLLSAGAIAFRGLAPLPLVIAVCLVGVLIGDTLLFLTAKKLGPATLRRSFVNRFLPAERRAKIRQLYASRGGVLVFVARYIAGVRAPVFAMAGAHGMSLRRFLFWDATALCISGPLMIGIGYFCSEKLASLQGEVAQTQRLIGISFLVVTLLIAGFLSWRARGRAPDTRSKTSPS